MSFKTPFICDRRVYDKKGKWHNPNEDYDENIFYFVEEPLSLSTSYDSRGKEEIKETITITIFGGKPIAKGDILVLEDKHKFEVANIIVNYIESNIMVKDMVKPRIASMTLVLE